MGTTIRRQPVNFDIPNSPNYKFLNITNFRGLDVSSNPFELATNTASDCLNVYVDETNTLTTRPRLEKKIDSPLDGTHIGTYNLHNGYLLHYIQNEAGVMARLTNGVLHNISGTIPTSKCRYFEQGDKIYLLDGERYMVVSDDTLKDVEGYVPTTIATDVKGTEFDIEPLNLLSNKFKKIYPWDGNNNPFGTFFIGESDTKNNAIKKTTFVTDLSDYKYFLYFTDDTCLLQNTKTGELFYGDIVNNLTSIFLQQTGIVLSLNNEVRYATHVGKNFEVLDKTSRGDRLVRYYYLGNGQWEENVLYDTNIYFDDTIDPTFRFAENDKVYTAVSTSKTNVVFNFIRPEDGLYGVVMGFDGDSKTAIGGLFKQQQSTLYPFYAVSQDNNDLTRFRLWVLPERYKSEEELLSFEGPSSLTDAGQFSADGNVYYNKWLTDKGWVVLVHDFTTNVTKTYNYPTTVSLDNFTVSSDGKTFYWTMSENDKRTLWVAPSNDPNKYYNTYVELNDEVLFSNAPNRIVSMSENAEPFNLYYWDNDNANISATLVITPNNELYSDWNERRKKLFKSTLIKRFDNNYWFASGNRYYRSQNNDPTYFPITEYNDLGDSNEEITGFNLANDTTLIAYKANRVYLIQPFTSSLDTREYTITESKNTVGNTAIGAPIVTTLTEIPLQINNDGIYGLSQVSNVSAIERIADLMSESINDRWLNIPDDIITKIQTLNRLYWTYVILPYDHKTVIYLLDNRTNSWYYWELPIVLNDAFVVNNRTEFVDKNGTIYYLTTEDIIDKNYDDQTVTKYYDYGKKLIRWHWQSQILPLGTINYSKRLVNTTFILTDTDDSDGYGLKYSFKVFRKLASSVPEKEIMDKLTLVRSTTRKTNISKFSFIQIRLDNLTEESRDFEAYENNKLRLVGLGLKYVLLEGLTR